MLNQLNNREFKQMLNRWENDWPVDNWKVDGVHIWPFIRFKLIFFFSNKNKKSEGVVSVNRKRFSSLRSVLFAPFKLLVSYIWLQIFFFQLKSKSIIFFGSYFHRTKNQGVHFNRFFDPMIHHHGLHKQVYVVEFQKVLGELYNEKAIIPLNRFLYLHKYWFRIRNKFQRKPAELILPKFTKFYSTILKEYPEIGTLGISEQGLKIWAQKIRDNAVFFERLFKKVGPSKIIMLSYYGFDDLTSAIFAAHDLGIKIVEFQHGPQTNVHMAYSAWSRIPQQGFNTMPNEYWNWDKKSQENIQKWSNGTGITAKVSGHPYLSYWVSRRDNNLRDSSQILYTLQVFQLDKMFSDLIINSINKCNFKWIFRLHPRTKYTISEIEHYLINRGVKRDKYSLHTSLQVPLPEVLAISSLHVTNYSGCLIEAKMMGVSSIIVHELGRDLYEDYIDDETVYYFDMADSKNTNEEFCSLIHKALNSKENKENIATNIVNPLSF